MAVPFTFRAVVRCTDSMGKDGLDMVSGTASRGIQLDAHPPLLRCLRSFVLLFAYVVVATSDDLPLYAVEGCIQNRQTDGCDLHTRHRRYCRSRPVLRQAQIEWGSREETAHVCKRESQNSESAKGEVGESESGEEEWLGWRVRKREPDYSSSLVLCLFKFLANELSCPIP